MPTDTSYHIPKSVQEEEVLIIEQAKKDMKHFAPLYDSYYERIFRYCYQRLETKEAAFDVTAQVFLKAMTNLNKYEYKGLPFASWLYRIAKSELSNEFNQEKKTRSINLNDKHLKDLFFEMKETDDHDELRSGLIRSLEKLKEEQLLLIEMRFFEKRSFKEIAEILDITENNAKVRLYRSIDQLKLIFKHLQLK